MKSFDFIKQDGNVVIGGDLHSWLDRQLRYITNGQYTLNITRKVKRRSLAQNRLMWLWFACMSRETGQPAMDFHDHYCLTLLGRDIANPITGVVERVGGHTSTLSKEAFADFLNHVQADAAVEFGITLPSPEDVCYQDFVDEYQQYI